MNILASAASGVRAQQVALDALADNLANLNTFGFKAERASFSETITQVRHLVQPAGEKTGEPLVVGSGVQLAGVDRSTLPGIVSESENPYSLAIQGEGYFRVRQPDQSVAYTRAGNFSRDATGLLVDEHGNSLEPALWIAAGADIRIEEDGRVLETDEDGVHEYAQLTLTRFSNGGDLQRIGDNLFQPAGNTTIITGAPGSDGLGRILAGHVERSSVELGKTMTDMIQVQRAYQMNARMIRNGDEMWSTANALRR
ncbi:MAG: flagellar hook-basal body protein [Peptococcaceae bacterium]|nr:flagellar hook-basal body protein [Peptococcaceae bacterium]